MRAHAAGLAIVGAFACGTPSRPRPSVWQVVLSGQQATLLSVWGTSTSSVYAVGGPLGDGTPTAMLRFDGTDWVDLVPGGTETLWWVHGSGSANVWAVGEAGRVVRWNGAKLTEIPRPTTATLYGVWVAAPDDVWVVGGSPEQGTAAPNDICLHFDGSAWDASLGPPATGRAFFKIWGTASNNLYVVGEAGTIWHRRGTAWSTEDSPPLATGTLLTVSGCSATEVYAVGNTDVLRSDGAAWSRASVKDVNDGVNGVSCAVPGKPVLVGYGGIKQRLVDGAWQDDFAEEPHSDMHGAWADPAGGFWAAGGDFVTDARDGGYRAGFVARYGPATR